MVYIHNGILPSCKEKWNHDIYGKIDRSGKYTIKLGDANMKTKDTCYLSSADMNLCVNFDKD